MVTMLGEGDQVSVPTWVKDLPSFRRWHRSDDFPEDGRIFFLDGEVWVDMSGEQLFTHAGVKGEYTRVVGNLAKQDRAGYLFPDGVMLVRPRTRINARIASGRWSRARSKRQQKPTYCVRGSQAFICARLLSVDAGFACKPAATFVSFAAFADRFRLIEGRGEGFIELEGSPDMVLEIVSRSSVHKDTVVLRKAYWEAGIREYWLVDARHEPVHFDILRHATRGYVAARKQNGWVKSQVFGKSFRLITEPDLKGNPDFTLEVR